MIYLIVKMAVYLVAAVATGAGAGWLTRNLAAIRREDELQRQLTDVKAKLPQYDSLMRARDEQLQSLRDELKTKDARIGELRDELAAGEKELRSKTRELKEAQARAGGSLPVAEDGDASQSDERVAELSAELGRLHSELSDARVRLAAAEAAASSSAEAQNLDESIEVALRSELVELESRLQDNDQEAERLNKLLEQERRRVIELERERELQAKSLQLLHQQLDVERGRAAAQG